MRVLIDTSKLQLHAQRIMEMGKSTFPVVTRQTLNSMAYDVKKETMPEEARRFLKRKPTFFVANSKVAPATGLDINSMRATVGFVPKTNDKSHAVEDLEAQEEGKEIGNRSFIALKQARGSRSWKKMVQGKFTMDAIHSRQSVGTRSSIVDARDARVPARFGKGKKNRVKYIKSAIAAGKGGFVLGTDRKKGNRFLLYINSVKRLDDGNTVVNSTPIYAVKAKRKVRPDSKYQHFMAQASQRTAAKQGRFFAMHADKALARLK